MSGDDIMCVAARLQALEDRVTLMEHEINARLRLTCQQTRASIAKLESAVLDRHDALGTSFDEPQAETQITSMSYQPITIELTNMHASSLKRESTPKAEALAIRGEDSSERVELPHSKTLLSFNSFPSQSMTTGRTFRGKFTKSFALKREENTLPQSPYEAVILIGNHSEGSRRARPGVILSIIVTLALQLVLCGSFRIMNAQKIGTISHLEARRWRTGPGHSSDLLGIHDYSHVSRVRSFDGALSISASQVQILTDIENYLQSDRTLTLWTFPFGSILVMTVTLTWSMRAIAELVVVLKYLYSLLTVPRGITRITPRQGRDPSMLFIESIDFRMRVLSAGACLCHALICAAAWWLGCKYISRTTSVEDMVINGLGVAVILDVEKSVFAILVAKNVQSKVKRVRFDSFRALAWHKVVAMAMLIFVTLYAEVIPLCKELEAYRREACSGDRHFVAGMSQETGLIIVAPSNVFHPTWKHANDHARDSTGIGHYKNVIKSIIWNKTWRESYSVFRESNVRNMRITMSQQLSNVRDEIDPSCEDLDLAQIAPSYLRTLRWQTGRPNAKGCSDFNSTGDSKDINPCHMKSSRLLRGLCPDACGCNNVESGLLFRSGCPNSCGVARRQRAESSSLLASIAGADGDKCRNFPPSMLSNLPAWKMYARSLIWSWNHSYYAFALFHEIQNEYLPEVARGRCLSISADDKHLQDVARLLCPRPSFAFWCPRSCGCDLRCRGPYFDEALCLPDCNPFCQQLPH